MNHTITPDAETSADAMAARTREVREITEIQLAMMKASGPNRRGQHPKQHGCVWARFEVLDDIPAAFKVGLFANPGTYTAYIRFSNGAQADDRKPDIHGMAIKVTGVPGKKILEGAEDVATQDFILADKPVFFIRDTDEYLLFMKDFAYAMFPQKPKDEPPLKAFFAWLSQNRPRDVSVAQGFQQQVQDSPLAARYWSQVPYAFGLDEGTICRYAVVPNPENISKQPVERDANYLQQAMMDQLTIARKTARFDFTVQLIEGATPAVIDDPTVEWDTLVQRVAVITIPAQDFASPDRMQFGENLSYNPWHALPEHRPVGQINEIRKAVYLASTALRHDTTRGPYAEPTGQEHISLD